MKRNFLILLFSLFFIGFIPISWGQGTEGIALKNDSITKRYSIGIELQNKAVYSLKFIISEIRSRVASPLTNIVVKDNIVQFTTSIILKEEEISQWINPYDAIVTSFNIGGVSGSNGAMENSRK